VSKAEEARPKRRFRWLALILIVIVVLVLLGLLFPSINGRGLPPKRVLARNDLMQVRAALRNYIAEYGAPPTGAAAKIMTALRGNNPQKIVFFEASANRFNRFGEFLDPWGSPFRIDTSNPEQPWAYSFGGNRIDEGGIESSDDIATWH
jgi:type II secretory pathway pseudopilin PulG